MKKTLYGLSILFLGIAIGFALAVILAPKPPKTGPGRPSLDDFQKQMSLSKEQVRKIRTYERNARSEIDRSTTALRKTEELFQKAVIAKRDDQDLKKIFEDLLQKKNDVERVHFQVMLKVHQQLSPEQIKKLGELRSRRP